jgi:hypothetical protein
MEHQFRRGIYRANAQRLSISLAPLVAQRSLLFRVKADLSTKPNYGQLTPAEDSPALFSMSSALFSGAMSSAASVYSQDSWKGKSPFVNSPLLNRRHAMAFSPSLQWEVYSKDNPRLTLPKSSLPFSSFPLAKESEIDIVVEKDASLEVKLDITDSVPLAENLPKVILSNDQANTRTTKTKSRVVMASKHAKAFMNHLLIHAPSSKKEAIPARPKTAINIVHVTHDDNNNFLQLPPLKLQLSPIRTSFIAKTNPEVLPLPAFLTVPFPSNTQLKASERRKRDTVIIGPSHSNRATWPPTPLGSRRPKTQPPPPPVLAAQNVGKSKYRSVPSMSKIRVTEHSPIPPVPPLPHNSVIHAMAKPKIQREVIPKF